MSERPVRLDIGTGGLADRAASGSGTGEQRSANDDEVARFRQALLSESEEESDARDGAGTRESDTGPGAGGHAPGAFGLFGHIPRMGLPGLDAQLTPGAAGVGTAPATPPAASVADDPSSLRDPDSLWQLADEMAKRILVSADGAREVRITVRDDVMAGVELRIAQEEGRWVVDFVISDPASLELLEQSGGQLAGELAERLGAAVEVRLAKPPEDGSQTEPMIFFAEPHLSDRSAR